MTIARGSLFAVIAVLSIASAGISLGAAEVWVTSWEAFVDAYNNCVRKEGCDVKQFADKSVTWTAKIRAIDAKDGKLNITMDMASSPPFVDKSGAKSDIIALTLQPSPSEQAAWSKASKGQQVRFKTKTIEIFGSAVGFTSGGPGQNIAVVFTTGAELVEALSTP